MNGFVKREDYEEPKFPRGIRAPTDDVKGIIGPLIKQIENSVYALPQFIKHVPVNERPAYIMKLNKPGFEIIATDYSSFESLFRAEIMKAAEIELYQYMCKNLPKVALNEFCAMLTGKNKVSTLGKGRRAKLKIVVEACRMSGEMTTSLGNGFTNLMVALYLCSRVGHTLDNGGVDGVVEGDDGLFVIRNNAPTKEDFAKLNFIIKIEKPSCLNEASFCKMVFDPIDKSNVTDPARILAKIGWTDSAAMWGNSKTLKQLLRAKGLSLFCELPRCPIVNALARYVVRITEGSRYRQHERAWKRYDLSKVVVSDEVPGCNRVLVANKYGITVPVQLQIEKWLDSLQIVHELDHPMIMNLMKPAWKASWKFMVKAGEKTRL